MSTSVVLGSSTDGYLESSSTSYSSALSGSNLQVPGNSSPLMYCGQSLGSGVRYVWQSFVGFSWTAPVGETPVAAYLRLTAAQTTGTSTSRDLEARVYDWGSSVGTGDWRTPAQLSSARLAARVADAHRAAGLTMRAGLNPADVETSATLRYVLASSRNRRQQAPSGLEWQTLRQAETANPTGQRPALVVGTAAKHRLDLSLGAQVQLSDGTHAYIEFNDTSPASSFSVRHHNGISASTIFVNAGTVTGRRGQQSYCLVADAHDNLYVLDHDSATASILHARVLVKGSGHTWTPGVLRTAALPTYEGRINQIAAAWHPQGSGGGTIVAVIGRSPGSGAGTAMPYALLDCGHLFTGAGSLLRATGDAEGLLVDASAPNGYNSYPNEVGTLLDVAAVPGSGVGYVLSTAQHQVMGTNSRQSIGRYELRQDGAGFASTARTLDAYSGFSVKDPDAKSRVIPLSGTQFLTVNVSSTTDFGATVKHRQWSPSGFSVLSDVRLDAQGLASMPDAATLSTSPAWDAVHDPAANRVWVYYLDTADPTRLMRTHVDLDTGLAAADEVEVATGVGAPGSANHAIRVHRGATRGQQVLITVANEDSGSHSLLYVTDLLNVPPTQPTLHPRPNFDATGDADFAWTFNDPNPADTQSAYQVEIYDDATDTLAYDSTPTASASTVHTVAGGSLTNGASYRWRVKTWDAAGEESPWSAWGYFATSASGNVTIITPATDNEPLETADVTIQWQVTGATQDEYRVVVVRTDTNTTHSDTGWVAGADTTYTVTGLASEVQYRIEVTIRDTGVASSTGTRLVTPDYTRPVPPVVTAAPVDDDAYIRVSVANPEPGQDLSTLDGTFEDGIDGWDTGCPRLIGHHSHLTFGSPATVNVPAGVEDGDLMLLWVTSNFDHAHTPPAGWTQPPGYEATTPEGHGATLYTRTASAEPPSYQVAWDDADNWHSATLIVVRGVGNLGEWQIDTTGDTQSATIPSVTARAGDWVLALGHTVSSGTRTITPPLTVLEAPGRGGITAVDERTTSGATGGYTLTTTGTALPMITAALVLEACTALEQSSDQAHSGSYSGKITVTGTPDTAGIRPDETYRVAVTPLSRYTATCWAYSTGGATVRMTLDWYDTNGDLISTSSIDTAIPPAEWTRVEHTASAPLNTATVGYGPDLVAPSDSEVMYVDDIVLRTATNVPIPATNQIWRSHSDGDAQLVATVGPDETYRDYLVGSGREYTYTAVAIAPDGSTATSEPVTAKAYFLGVWIHDPADPEGTIRQYLYGRAQRSDSTDVEQAQHHYLGREHPVTHWGEHTTERWQITVDVPEDATRLTVTDTLRQWAQARRTLVVRDNRGRVFAGTTDGFGVADQEWGDAVSWTMTRVDSTLPRGDV